jgi:hypothetical protein
VREVISALGQEEEEEEKNDLPLDGPGTGQQVNSGGGGKDSIVFI